MHYVERRYIVCPTRMNERLQVREFKHAQDMHKFLNTSDNALRWVARDRGLTAGTYAFVGGAWHNVRNLDADTLAHV